MPAFQKTERLSSVLWADSNAVKGWRDKARVQAISAMSLVRNPDYIVYAVRNSRDTLLGLAAIRENAEDVRLLHLASRDAGRGIGSLLICEIDMKYDKRIKTMPEPSAISFYEYIGWRKVGKEYWSR